MSINDDKKKKENLEISGEVSFVNEKNIDTGNIVSADYSAPSLKNTQISVQIPEVSTTPNPQEESLEDILENIFNNSNNSTNYITYDFLLGDYMKGDDTFSLENIKSDSQNYANSYAALCSYINANKDNPEILRKSINNLLKTFNEMYDSEKNHIEISDSQEGVMDQICNTKSGEELSGFICMTMHEFVMKALNDCGINAAVLCGGTDASNHATLLYQLEDGKYVYNNYQKSLVIEASNIKDAMAEVYKNSGKLHSCGYYTLVDGKYSYQEFALEKESAFGEKMDKRAYLSQTPFDNKPSGGKSYIKGRAEVSSLGNIKAGADTSLNLDKGNKESELNVSIEYRNNGETEIFHNSNSLGLDAGYKSITHKPSGKDVFFDVNMTTSYTSGATGDMTYNLQNTEDVQKAFGLMAADIKAKTNFDVDFDTNYSLDYKSQDKQYLSTFIKGGAGFSSDLISSDNMALKHAFQGSLLGGATFDLNSSSVFGDVRVLAEEGLNLNNKLGQLSFDNTVSAGVGADLKLQGGEQKPGIQPVFKLNAQSGIGYESENLWLGVKGQAYTAVTPSVKETGFGAGVFAQYKPEGKNTVIFGQANTVFKKQKLTLGGFNEQSENNVNFNVGAGIRSGNHTFTADYQKYNDKLNATKNYSTFTLGYKMNF